MKYTDFIPKIEKFIVKKMHELKIPGMSVAIVKGEDTIYAKGFGARELKNNQPATENTLYGIGSITKSITSLAILQLQEEGKLTIDDPITDYFPIEIGYKDKPIKIKHLMSHSSGIPNLGLATVLINRFVSSNDETFVPMSSVNDLMLFINGASDEVIAEPGNKFLYFNLGYCILGLIVEKMSDMNFDEYVKQKILNPLEMKSSVFEKTDFEKSTDKMAPYLKQEKKISATLHPFDQFIYAAGGLLSNALDMANYLKLFLNDGLFKNKKILDSKLIQMMYEPFIDTGYPSKFGKFSYGFGLSHLSDFYGETFISHGGSTGVSSAFLSFIKSKKLGVFVGGNVGAIQGDIISHYIFSFLLGKDPHVEHPIIRLDSKLDQLVGTYQNYKGLNKIEISKNDFTLVGKTPKQKCSSFTLIPNSDRNDDYSFWTPDGVNKFPVEFIVNDKTGGIKLQFERNVFTKIS